MTGRELILYILNNNLEDEPITKSGTLIGYITIADAASKFGVGEATVKVWFQFGVIEGIKVGETILIEADAVPDLGKNQWGDISIENLKNIFKPESERGNSTNES